jgi:uncharacterized protein (TIGR02099 family)
LPEGYKDVTRFKRILTRTLWALGWSALTLLVLVRVGWYQVSNLEPSWRPLLENRLGGTLKLDGLSTRWHGAMPIIEFDRLVWQSETASLQAIHLDASLFELDLIASLRDLAPRFQRLESERIAVSVQQGRALPENATSGDGLSSPPSLEPLFQVLHHPKHVRIGSIEASFTDQSDQTYQFLTRAISWNNTAAKHVSHIDGNITFPDQSQSDVSLTLDGQFERAAFTVFAKLNRLKVAPEPFVSLLNVPDGQTPEARVSLWLTQVERGEIKLDSQIQMSAGDTPLLSASLQGFWLQSEIDALLYDGQLTPTGATAPITLPTTQLALDVTRAFPLLSLSMDHLDLSVVSQSILSLPNLPEDAHKALSMLDPSGTIHNLVVRWPEGAKALDFEASGDLDNVALDEYFGSPVVSGVNGRLTLTKDHGAVDLITEDFSMGFPGLFENSWGFQKAQGKVYWSIDRLPGMDQPAVTVNSGLLKISDDNVKAQGRFRLFVPVERAYQSDLTLMIGMDHGDGVLASDFVPPKEAGVELHAWLKKAVKGGVVRSGQLLLRVDTRSLEDRSPPTIQLYLDVDKGQLHFLEGWPDVNDARLTLWLDQEGLRINAPKARLLDSDGRVEVSADAQFTQLNVHTSLSGVASNIQKILETPQIQSEIGDGLNQWRLKGKHATDVKVVVNLRDANQPPKVNVRSALTNATFSDVAGSLVFDRINGQLAFSTEKGLSADQISGRFLGNLLKGQIRTVKATNEQPTLTRVSMSGPMEIEALRKWSGYDFLSGAEGKAQVNGRMDICSGSPECNKLVVSSNLKGVALNLPAPWGKQVDTEGKMELVAQLGIEDPVWRFNLNDQIRGVIKQLGQSQAIKVNLNGKRPVESKTPGVQVEGEIAQLDVDTLISWLDNSGWLGDEENSVANQGKVVDASQSNEANPDLPVNVTLSADQIVWGDFALKHVDLVFNQKSGKTTLGLMSPMVTGQVRWPETQDGAYQVKLNQLRVSEQTASDAPTQNKADSNATAALDTAIWPKVNLIIDSLMVGDKTFGAWRANLSPNAQGFEINDIEGRLADLVINGRAGWQANQAQGANSYLTLNADGRYLGKAMKQLGYGGVLESEQTRIMGRFNWPGYLWDFKSGVLSGQFDFDLQNGRLIESGNTANVLRIFGILNLNTIARRLRLNFNDLVEKGVAFDQLTARFASNNGVASTREPLTLKGPSADITLMGDINLKEQSIDSQMDVVLPLTGNLPIAALLLGAPQVAGAVFIIDKLIGDKLEKVTTLRYELKGPLDEPEINVLKGQQEKAPDPLNDL